MHRTFVCDCLRASFYVFFLFKIKNFPVLLPFPEKVQLNCSAILQPAKPVSQSEWPICLCLLEACSATSDSNLRPVKKQQRECTHKRTDSLTSCDQHLAALSRADFNRKKRDSCVPWYTVFLPCPLIQCTNNVVHFLYSSAAAAILLKGHFLFTEI